ncbi:SIR2 family protein [Nannocystis radixulma]|uniref:SIR2 family protein n=1 Tax=Nannocystis radixulma TaxID=2995305 RepID=A0ABT5BKT4_9BACT|nr:SIR2 family protein [Nannocystis radixulma]MDC0674760.1 SIR2 family protein [Nannocystis radixulma]
MAVLSLTDAIPLLREAHREQRLIPFLGAGFSQPLGLPQWDALMGWMAEDLGFDPALFKLHGTALQLAEYLKLVHPNRLPRFIARIEERFHSDEAQARRKKSEQHKALARCGFRSIYTTNFERHIEGAFSDARKRVMTVARDLDFARPVPPGTCAVYKFHGDFADPDTIVLTESQFFNRFSLDAAPDLRLRTDLLTNVFLFIGYSFNDPNIRYIWHRMDMMRRRASGPTKRRGVLGDVAAVCRSYWVSFGAGPVQPKLLDRWNIDVIELDGRDKSRSIVQLLTPLQPRKRRNTR